MDRKPRLGLHADRFAAALLAIAGAIALVLGYVGTSGTALVAEQLPYIISGGVGGLFLLGAGATLWLSADLRDEWQALDDIRRHLAVGTSDHTTSFEIAADTRGDEVAVHGNGRSAGADDTVAVDVGHGGARP